jgi:membrane protease YdiL (CAAX protease family)
MFPLIITGLTAGIYMSGMPFVLLNYKIANNNVFFIVNVIFASLFCFLVTKLFYPDWNFGFNFNNFRMGFLTNGYPIIIGSIIILIASYFIYRPLDKLPLKGEIIVWVVIYYFVVAIVEELFLRGLFLNTLVKLFNNKIILAIIISSIIFALGHIPGMLHLNIGVALIRIIGILTLGIFLGCIYIKSGNLCVVILLHWMVNMSTSVLYYFSSSDDLNKITTAASIIVLFVSIYSIIVSRIS